MRTGHTNHYDVARSTAPSSSDPTFNQGDTLNTTFTASNFTAAKHATVRFFTEATADGGSLGSTPALSGSYITTSAPRPSQPGSYVTTEKAQSGREGSYISTSAPHTNRPGSYVHSELRR